MMRRFLWIFVAVALLGAPNAWPQETDDGEIIYAVAALNSLSSRRWSLDETNAMKAEAQARSPDELVVISIHTCGITTAAFEILFASNATPATMTYETRLPWTCEQIIDFAHTYYFMVIKDDKVVFTLPIYATFDDQSVFF